jgi:hypothetical protein
MKYKIHPKYEGEKFWTQPEPPKGFRTARTCENCGKMSISSTGPKGVTMVCNEVTEYQGVWEDTNIPRVYSRQAFYAYAGTVCDEHKFEYEMEKEE